MTEQTPPLAPEKTLQQGEVKQTNGATTRQEEQVYVQSKFTTYLLGPIKLTALACVSILSVSMLFGLLYLITPRIPFAYALHISGLTDLADYVIAPYERGDREKAYVDVRSHYDVISRYRASASTRLN
jgi:hypothetical protein